MQIVVLAGGLATRLYPLTKKIPKSLLPILGKPFVDYQMELFVRNGISEVVFCLGHLSEQIIEYFEEGKKWGIKMKYSLENQPLDTGGALFKARKLLKEDFLTIYGDSYLLADYREAYRVYKNSGQLGLMTVYHNRNRIEPSRVLLEGKFIKEYQKDSPPLGAQHMEYGLNIFNKKVFELVKPKNPKFPISYYFDCLTKRNQLIAHEIKKRFYEIGSQEGIKDLTKFLKRENK